MASADPIVAEKASGQAAKVPSPRSSDEMVAVGADYFYPFAWGMVLAVGLLWTAAGLIATVGRRSWRPYLIGGGGVVLIAQLILLGAALVTYINVTD